MDPRHLFKDERMNGFCVYCGAPADTRDHVPAKVLLDEPYPSNLPVVGACKGCNEGFSLDEEYLSCLLECVICGTSEPTDLYRPNIRRILVENSMLKHRLEESQQRDLLGNLLWQPEEARLKNIITKLARGHVAYELYPKLEEPIYANFAPLVLLDTKSRNIFENIMPGLNLFPEIGSRSFFRSFGKKPDQFEQIRGWIVIQPGLYRYSVIETSGIIVRIVLSEYLAIEVYWD